MKKIVFALTSFFISAPFVSAGKIMNRKMFHRQDIDIYLVLNSAK